MEEDKLYNHDGELTGTSKEEIISGIDAFKLDEEQYDYFPPDLWKDKDIIFSCISAENNIEGVFEYVHESEHVGRRVGKLLERR